MIIIFFITALNVGNQTVACFFRLFLLHVCDLFCFPAIAVYFPVLFYASFS